MINGIQTIEINSEKKHFSINQFPLLNDKGKKIGDMMVGRDITDIKEKQFELTKAMERAERANIAKGESEDINVTFDASNTTRNGTYKFNIFVQSNDPSTPFDRVACNAYVTGFPTPSIAVDPDTVNSAINAYENPKKTETITIYNNGPGELLYSFDGAVQESSLSIPAVAHGNSISDEELSFGIVPEKRNVENTENSFSLEFLVLLERRKNKSLLTYNTNTSPFFLLQKKQKLMPPLQKIKKNRTNFSVFLYF